VINGKLYMAGGKGSISTSTTRHEAYEAAIDAWAQRADMPTIRSQAAGAAAGGWLFVLGGLHPNGTPLGTNEVYFP
jgi:hypothetical protein